MPPNSAAIDLVELALAKPEEVLRRLEELAATHEAHAVVWAHGLALRELGRLREAEKHLDRAVELARELGDVEEARVRTSRAVLRQSLGDVEGALDDTEWAARHLTGADAGRNESQRGLILQRLGRNEEALAVYERAQPLLELHGDSEAANRLRSNRAAILAYQGRLDEARDDLRAAAAYGEAGGDPMAVASAEHNLGFLEGRAGNIPAALEHFSRAANLFGDGLEAGRLGILVTDRAETLADAGLFAESLALVRQAIDALEEAGAVASLAEAQLLAARVHALAGEPQQAQELAAEARANFETLGQTGWSSKAAWIEVMAAYEAGAPVDAQAARDLGQVLATQGWHVESHLLLLQAADAAVDEGDLDLARALVRLLRGSDRNVPAMVKVGRHRAIARTRLALGDRTGARRAITAALKLLHEHRVTFGSAELRAHASRHGHGLSQLALGLALGDDRPDDALVALDLIRDTEQPVWGRPHADPEVASDLEALRQLDGRLRDASRGGFEDASAATERAAVERRIRDRLRRRHGRVMPTERLDVPALHRALGDRVLRSWFVHGGRLGVVTVDDHGRRLQLLGPVDEATDQIDAWRFALRRLVEGSGRTRRLEDAAMSATAATARLTELLGLHDHPPGRPLVVVPTGPLRGIAWLALPALAGCQVSVVPSARHWLTTHGARAPSTRVLVAAGPGLDAAVRETEEVAARHRDSIQLADESATADAVVAGLDSAAIGHLAAHGSFRWDNPLFSALQFADGPVWLHDFERLGRAPHTLVLSSCDMAMDRVVAGDAVLGMASGLLQLGVASLIAPVVPVPDEEVADFMIALHERMAAGATGSEALAATAAAFDGDTPRRQAVRQSFVAFGA